MKMEAVADVAPFSLEPADSACERWERWARRFENFVVAKDIHSDTIMRAMLLHYAGEAVFELSETVVVTEYYDNFAQKLNGSSLLASGRQTQCSEEYEIFKFRQADRTTSETLDQFNARLQQLSKNCNFHEKDRN